MSARSMARRMRAAAADSGACASIMALIAGSIYGVGSTGNGLPVPAPAGPTATRMAAHVDATTTAMRDLRKRTTTSYRRAPTHPSTGQRCHRLCDPSQDDRDPHSETMSTSLFLRHLSFPTTPIVSEFMIRGSQYGSGTWDHAVAALSRHHASQRHMQGCVDTSSQIHAKLAGHG